MKEGEDMKRRKKRRGERLGVRDSLSKRVLCSVWLRDGGERW